MLFNLLTRAGHQYLPLIKHLPYCGILQTRNKLKEVKWLLRSHRQRADMGLRLASLPPSWSCLSSLEFSETGISQVPGFGMGAAVLCWCCHLVTRQRTVATTTSPFHPATLPPLPSLSWIHPTSQLRGPDSLHSASGSQPFLFWICRNDL